MKIRNTFIESILNSINDGVFAVNKNFKITYLNKSAENITKFSQKEALGKYCYEIFRTNICNCDCALKKTLKSGEKLNNVEINILNKNNEEIPLCVNTAVLVDENGNFLGGVETFRDLSEIKFLSKELNQKYNFHDIVSKNKKIHKIFSFLPDISESDVTVLVTGESGTGKELFASALHNMSNRKNNAFIKVNCAAIPETLLETELFGYKKGAFTNADKDKPGRFKLADGGTIFLDEIGDLPLTLQSKILRVLQEKEYDEIGGTKTIKTDVRVIAATNKNLEDMVKNKTFREDLYYRLCVIKIDIPPLRDRKEDIHLLLNHLIEKYNKKYNKNIKSISNETMNILLNYDYPGNIREMQNIIEHSFVLCNTNDITYDYLPDYLKRKKRKLKTKNLKFEIISLKHEKIMETLKKNNYNRTKTAKELKIDRSTLWRWMKKLPLDVSI